ncbi:MAG: ribosome small subunit-dependent GTPase A [Methanomicrobiales archaeon]|jgi:ribosome biogenesis GTPase|nr:ribosome small subunit-dependent GTPase A [Methanomicrobiales archaeon]
MIDLKQYGYIETEPPPSGLLPARITEHRGSHYKAITERGEVTAVLKGSLYHNAESREDFPCVGDFVLLHYNDHGNSRIATLLPRHSKFSRADFSGHATEYAKTVLEQVVATNFDYAFILSSLNWDFNINRIIRYLTQARQSGGQPVIILTKADVVEDFNTPLHDVKQASPDVPVHVISAHTGFGLNAVHDYLKPKKTVVFLGMSGVGKSSLLNALMSKEVMAVKEIREDDSRGRHTTTHRQLFMLPSGAMVIDTPGMRELGLFDASEGISASFTDVEDLFTKCRFSNCQHRTEPSCAVLSALADGTLPREHWERYLSQIRENKFVNDKKGYQKEKEMFHKSISKWNKQNAKNREF